MFISSASRIAINHGIVLFGSGESDGDIEFDGYDPNIPDRPVKLHYGRAGRPSHSPGRIMAGESSVWWKRIWAGFIEHSQAPGLPAYHRRRRGRPCSPAGRLSRTCAAAEMVKEVKRGSSLWAKARDALMQDFGWAK